MNQLEEHLLWIAALGVGAWLFFISGSNSSAPNSITQGYSDNASTNLPWYASYNVTPPATMNYMAALPNLSVGIENTGSGGSCSSCTSLFGTTYGSTY
jgi:hypothetical protein